MEKIVRQTLLFDFYGELLTEHQQRIFEEVVCNDTSCSEVAEQEGTSRQSVHDLVNRSSRQLEQDEEKLHLLEKFLEIRSSAQQIREEARVLSSRIGPDQAEGLRRIIEGADSIISVL